MNRLKWIRLIWCLALLGTCLTACISIEPERKIKLESAPQVRSIFPSSDTLPENLLRFYVQFDRSMKTVHNLEHIRLLDEQGKEVEGAIFNNVYELWDHQQTQLTLIFDPARVKTGLQAHEAFGRALRPGKHYRLVIETAEDIHGNHLAEAYEKQFVVGPADERNPKLADWTMEPPKIQTRDGLTIHFPNPIDQLSLQTKIRILDAQGRQLDGQITISRKEKKWTFTPDLPWNEGMLTVQVSGRLEDLAGNNLNGLFDHQLGTFEEVNEDQLYERTIIVSQ